jgi:TonB family protein
MGYQALLFCLDQKLARVVTQVFSELDFTVEPVNEPFAAVKKLMAQRYDAIVVDCENEPNASLLFKSARNSNSNQNSLALALVEGQAGVAKAYRIGANLVLTKPINVEQAKGTLRVARGLLRKNLDAASSASVASPAAPKVAPAPAASTFKPVSPTVVSGVPARNIYEAPEFDTPLPATAASSEVDDSRMGPPLHEAATSISGESDPLAGVLHHASTSEPAKPAPPAPVKSPLFSLASAPGTAAATAPAREAPAPVAPKPAPVHPVEHAQSSSPTFIPGSSPSFAALEQEESDGLGVNKKVLAIAAVILVVGVLGYFGWTKVGKTATGSHASSLPTPVSTASTTPSPVASAAPAPSETSPVTATVPTQNAKPSPTISAPATARTFVESEPVTKKAEPAPIIVKSNPAGKKIQVQSEEAAPQVPNPLAVASPNDKNLAGLVASVPAPLPKAVSTTLKISQGISQGLLIKRVQPRYPQNALSMRVQGAVQLEATINKEGSITNVKVLSGDLVLAHAATEAVRQWRYKPYYLDGAPVEIQTQITVNFKLPN